MSDSGNRRQIILVVEDFADTRQMVALELRRQGYEVLEAANGQEALEVAKRSRPDLVVMDLSLPKLDGLSAVYRIRETEATRRVPVIACSAHSPDVHFKAARAVGCDEYITKPIDMARLTETISRLLSGGREGRKVETAWREPSAPRRSDEELLDYIESLLAR